MAKTPTPAPVSASEPAPPPIMPEGVAELVEAAVREFWDKIIAEELRERLMPAFEKAIEAAVNKLAEKEDEAFEASIKAYLDANLPDLVKAALPPTPEQVQQRERESAEEAVRRQRQAAERRAKAEQRAAEKAAAAAAEEQAKRDADARKAFENAAPFIGEVGDLKANIIRSVMIDDGTAYSADHVIKLAEGDTEPTIDGGLILLKPIELPANGRAFDVAGVSLITDAGRMRLEIGGKRTVGGGKAVHFPARSLIFRPEPAAQD